MRSLSVISGLCLGALLTSCVAQQEPTFNPNPKGINVYVSPTGDDANDGNSPNTPILSIQQAQKLVRSNPKRGETPITVHLLEGTYTIESELTFIPEDGGTEQAPVTWQAFSNHKPIISGGKTITGWKVDKNGIWSVTIPDAINGNQPDGKWNITQLFVNGQRRQRCRLPKTGYFRMKDRAVQWGSRDEASKNPRSYDTFIYREEEVKPWNDVSNAVIVMYNSWTASIHWIKEINPTDKTLTFTQRMHWPVGYWDKQARFHLENLKEAFTDPGEWLMDYKTGTLSYKPMPGETPENTTVIAPVAKQLLTIKGDDKLGLYVEHLNFRGIAFQHCLFPLNVNEMHDGQAAVGLTAAVQTEGARHCEFSDLEISQIGVYGFWFGKGSQHNKLIRSELHDLGGGGVRIGLPGGEGNPDTACGYNLVENCFIHNGGLIAPAAVGAIIFKSSYNTLRHNEICDLYYSAVSIGWSWGYAPSSANNNICEYNHLHHIGYGVLSDMGAIYTLGISPGTTLRGNHIHDVFSYSYGGWGLYTDEGSTGVLMEHNVVYNTKSGGFHQHYGRDNIVRNNILAFAKEGQIIRSRQEDHSSFTVQNNVVIFDNGRPYGGNWGNKNYTMKNNLYWDVTKLPFAFAGFTLEEAQEEEGNEIGSVIVDPKFRNPKEFDFQLLPGSPAKPYIQGALDAQKIAGLTGPKWWTDKPKAITFKSIDPYMIQPPTDRPKVGSQYNLKLDFGLSKLGDKSPEGHTNGESDQFKTSIRVSDDINAPGTKYALKFVDAPGQAVNWQPHLTFGPRWRKNIVVGEFDAFLKTEDAILWHEWRDSSAPYKVGPNIRCFGNGKLTSMDKEIGTVPFQTWFHVKITCKIGKQQDKPVFDLEITPQGGQTTTYENLPIGNNDWNQVTWLGFVSEADAPSIFYLGNIDFKNIK